jgi:NAD(P) transhydrogenase subunit alpha
VNFALITLAAETQTAMNPYIALLIIFVLAVFIGFEIITKVPPTLHTPLMSGSNAISGITIVGAVLATHAGDATQVGNTPFGMTIAFLAIVMAMVNVVGGYLVTHRMLGMFNKKKG